MISICEEESKNRVIIIAEDIDLRILYALKYSKGISEDIIVFATFVNSEDEQALQLRWNKIRPDIPLVLRYSPDSGVMAPLLDFLYSSESGIGAGENVTVVLPRLVVTRPWQNLLHNQSTRYIARSLSMHHQIKVEVVPVPLEDDDIVLGAPTTS